MKDEKQELVVSEEGKLDLSIYATLIKAFVKLGDLNSALAYYEEMRSNELKLKSGFILSMLIEELLKNGMEGRAISVFEEHMDHEVPDKKTGLPRRVCDS